MKALILTGPRDGELIEYRGPRLEIADVTPEEIPNYAHEPVPAEPPEVKVLFYKAVIFYDGNGRLVDVYVPAEWPDYGRSVEEKVMGHLLRKAFKDAAK